MFTIEFRVSEPLAYGRTHLTRDWSSLGKAPTVRDAEVSAAWLIHEIQEFAASASRPRAIEYRILSSSGEIVTTNKV